MKSVDFAVSPFLVIWETTQACSLACRHCRASARPQRDPGELSTEEGLRVVDQVAAMGTPLLVFSGGDPVSRPDLFELVRQGKKRGLRTATIPAATDLLTRDLVQGLKDSGLDQMALSLDFPRSALHDGFRGVPGSARWRLYRLYERLESALPFLRPLGDTFYMAFRKNAPSASSSLLCVLCALSVLCVNSFLLPVAA